jgi:coatomer subunit epsilon
LCLAKGGESSQGAFYIYEELATSSTATAKSLLGQGVSEIQLGRLPEAESTLKQALEKDPQNPDILANAVVCATLSGKDYSVYLKYDTLFIVKADTYSALMGTEHQLVIDLKEKSVLFDQLSASYAVSAAS